MTEEEIAKRAAEVVAAVASLVAAVAPVTAPVAGTIAALATLARGIAQAIGAGRSEEAKAALEEADRVLSAAISGLPRRLADNDAKADARLNGFEESHTPPDGTNPEGSSDR